VTQSTSTVTLGVVMDPIDSIKPSKDSTLAMLLEAQKRGWHLHYTQIGDLFVQENQARAYTRELQVFDDREHWFELGDESILPLSQLKVVLMRKDPPFDIEYLYATYILEQAELGGCLVVNRPRSLRDANEKLFCLHFPECIPPTLVTRRSTAIRAFLTAQRDIILKPLGGMGGTSVFRVRVDDPNISVIIETLTDHANRFIMAQRFVPEIAAGDKRILMVNGEPVPYALARIPAPGETRGNLAAGGRGHGIMLSERDRWIAQQVGPTLRERGILFAGLDVIGDYLTEINVTSPTCIRELDREFGLNIAGQLCDEIATKIQA